MNYFLNYFKFQFGHFLVYFVLCQVVRYFWCSGWSESVCLLQVAWHYRDQNLSSTTPGTRGVIKILV